MTDFPRQLTSINGPFVQAKIDGALVGMGDAGDATRELGAEGIVQPDLITGMTLALISRQPRKPRTDGKRKASGTAGKVWVRERFTIHRPIAHDEVWTVTGMSTGTYVRKGRSYSTTTSESFTANGERFASNLTTGLFSYRPDPTKPDSVEGLAIEDTPAPVVDRTAAASNPCTDALRTARVGERLGGKPVHVSLAMMAARDTDNPDNPIHSDVDEARKAGLGKPIAGGSHVLAFALEPIMGRFGTHCLLHGATFDVRWKAPTECDVDIVPTATVTAATGTEVELDLRVDLASGPTAMVGTVTIPTAQ